MCMWVAVGGGSFQNTSYKCFDGTTIFLVVPSGLEVSKFKRVTIGYASSMSLLRRGIYARILTSLKIGPCTQGMLDGVSVPM